MVNKLCDRCKDIEVNLKDDFPYNGKLYCETCVNYITDIEQIRFIDPDLNDEQINKVMDIFNERSDLDIEDCIKIFKNGA